jgi:hypothetical protein
MADLGRHAGLVAFAGPAAAADIGDEVARRRDVAHRHQGQQMVQRGEYQRRILLAAMRQQAQLLPAVTDIDAVLPEPPQQRGGIGHVADIVGRRRPHVAVVDG